MKKLAFIFLAAIAACTSAPKTELDVIDRLKILDKPMKKPAMDEWLFEHKKAGQTFAAFQKLKTSNSKLTVRQYLRSTILDFRQ